MPRENRVAGWYWRLIVTALLIVLVGTVLLVIVLALGAADVPPVAPPATAITAAPGGCLPEEMPLPAEMTAPFSLELAARLRDPNAAGIAAWGIWLDEPDSALRWLVVAPGYVFYDGATHAFFHVTDGSNTLRVDVADGQCTIWANRERVVAQPCGFQTGAWGLAGGAAICWEQVTVYAEPGRAARP
jgi:hypothetical protein